jgi:hypothetical protein
MDEPFEWESEQQLAIENMNTQFRTAPALRHFNIEGELMIETEVSTCVAAPLLSQSYDEGVLHPIAYYSKNDSSTQCN